MYNPKQAIEKAALPQDAIVEGVITAISDGRVKNFIQADVDWKGDKESPAINIVIEVKGSDNKAVELKQLFTYVDNNGVTEFSPRSNMSKFKAKYGQVPEVGMKVKIQTSKEGFGKLKLD